MTGGGGPTATDERLNRAFNDWQAVSHTAAFGRWQTFAAGWNAAVVAERERADTAEQLIARQLGKWEALVFAAKIAWPDKFTDRSEPADTGEQR